MYVLSGKGSVAGVDLAASVLKLCQQKGVLWDNDLPEYTLDFATQTPSVSKSIREGQTESVVSAFNAKLQHAEQVHDEYMLLCLTAHSLIPQLQTKMQCINLWDYINPVVSSINAPIAFLGTLESFSRRDDRFILLPDQVELMGDLITAVKRGYSHLGENYAAHPKNLLKEIVKRFQSLGVQKFFLACTDLQACRRDLVELGVDDKDIIDIIELAAVALVDRVGRAYTPEFLDSVSDTRTYFRYKYVSESDAPQTDKKTLYLERLISTLPFNNARDIHILDVGGSSTGHSLRLARQLTDQHCHITLLDISEASLSAAKPMHLAADNISTVFINDRLEAFNSDKKFDAVLCVGVLLCISCNIAFVTAIKTISDLMEPGAILITRDCLSDEDEKLYMAFGGVIRSRPMYEKTFLDVGLELIESNEFLIEEPIRRNIVTTIFRKLN